MRVTAIFLTTLCLFGCGGAAAEQSPRLGNLALSGYGASGSVEHPRGRAEEPLQLAGGQGLVGVDALTRFESDSVDGESVESCAVYSLRTSADGFVEGRTTRPCPPRDAEFAPVPRESLTRVAAQRSLELREALTGARVAASSPTSPGILVRVVTSQGTVAGSVAPVRWPHPDVVEPSFERPPNDLEELWEAVLHPQRYAATGASNAPN